MNKKQLMTKIATTLNQSKADAERTFDSILSLILDCLKNDEQVKIAGFGTYKVAKNINENSKNKPIRKNPSCVFCCKGRPNSFSKK